MSLICWLTILSSFFFEEGHPLIFETRPAFRGNRHFTISQTTHLASPLSLLLLCGVSLIVRPDVTDENYSILNLDDWAIFKCKADAASGLVMLRKRLESAFLHAISEPSLGTDHLTEMEMDALETVGYVLKSAHKSASVR